MDLSELSRLPARVSVENESSEAVFIESVYAVDDVLKELREIFCVDRVAGKLERRAGDRRVGDRVLPCSDAGVVSIVVSGSSSAAPPRSAGSVDRPCCLELNDLSRLARERTRARRAERDELNVERRSAPDSVNRESDLRADDSNREALEEIEVDRNSLPESTAAQIREMAERRVGRLSPNHDVR